MIYSAHDDHIANIYEWIRNNNLQMDYFLYASTFVFELSYDKDCIKDGSADESCFKVNVLLNGNPLGFDRCITSSDKHGIGCSYKDFKTHMASIWYDGESADNLDSACDQLPEHMRPVQVTA